MKNLPLVSLIIVARNEEKFIGLALNSFFSQSYPKELLEIILVDGISSDRTLVIAEQLLKNSGLRYQILTNARKTLACGWNIAIKAANGDYVCRIDAHGVLAKDYIERGIKNLLSNNLDVVSVGGQLENKGEGFWGKIAQDFYSSRFGVGNSPFRIRSKEKFFSDTVAMGIYRKTGFYEVGFFDEHLDRNQDIALHKKMLSKGYRFLTDPEMLFVYYVRSSFLSFLKKAYQDGFWVIYSRASYLRHKVPLFFLGYIFLLILLKILRQVPNCFFLPLKIYFFLSLFFAIKDGNKISKALLPLMFLTYHLSYGLGSFIALTTACIEFSRKRSHFFSIAFIIISQISNGIIPLELKEL